MSAKSPPRWLERLLVHFLHPRDRETISGDLLEEYREEQQPRLGSVRANIWYARQSLSFISFWNIMGPPVRRILIAISLFTAAAGSWLAVMENLLRHAGYPERTLVAAATVIQAAATLLLLAYDGGRIFRALVSTGALAIVLFGASAVQRILQSPHFEGFVLLIGLALVLQGVLTLLVLLRPRQPRLQQDIGGFMRYRTPRRPAATRAVGIVVVALLTSLCAVAADFSGKWSGSSPDDKALGPVYAVLRQDGAALTGSAGPNESHQFPITTGKVDGDSLVFEVKTNGGVLRFELTAVAGDLKGAMRIFEDDGHTATANVVLKRLP